MTTPDPRPLEEKLAELTLKFEQYQLKLDQKFEDTITIFRDTHMRENERVSQVKDLLGVDLEFVLIHTIKDSDADIRKLSALALNGTNNEECLKALCDGLAEDLSFNVMAYKIALRGRTDPIGLKVLCEGLTHAKRNVRLYSAELLNGTSDIACREALKLVAKDDRDPKVRETAARALIEKQ